MKIQYSTEWNNVGKKFLGDQPGFLCYSSDSLHSFLWYLTGTMYCYVVKGQIWTWDTELHVYICVGSVREYRHIPQAKEKCECQ